MASTIQHQDAPIVGINVTPLVDVMLVLLAIFMLTAKLDRDPALPLDLPKARSGQDTERVLSIAIDQHGVRRVDGQPMPDDAALTAKARAMHAKFPALRTVLAASSRAQHGVVMHALDALRMAGVVNIAFAVDAAQASEPKR